MPTVFALILLLVSAHLVGCGHPISTTDCDRLLERYAICQIPVTLEADRCAQRFGRIGTTCAHSFDQYARCIEQTPCSALADPNASALCKNEFISLDIDCDGADFSD